MGRHITLTHGIQFTQYVYATHDSSCFFCNIFRPFCTQPPKYMLNECILHTCIIFGTKWTTTTTITAPTIFLKWIYQT